MSVRVLRVFTVTNHRLAGSVPLLTIFEAKAGRCQFEDSFLPACQGFLNFHGQCRVNQPETVNDPAIVVIMPLSQPKALGYGLPGCMRSATWSYGNKVIVGVN